jgi:hypothetical protein
MGASSVTRWRKCISCGHCGPGRRAVGGRPFRHDRVPGSRIVMVAAVIAPFRSTSASCRSLFVLHAVLGAGGGQPLVEPDGLVSVGAPRRE